MQLGPGYLAISLIFAFLASFISPFFWLLAGVFGLSAGECLNLHTVRK